MTCRSTPGGPGARFQGFCEALGGHTLYSSSAPLRAWGGDPNNWPQRRINCETRRALPSLSH
eukprot:6328685-Pyramimonas_sp.AAC.1